MFSNANKLAALFAVLSLSLAAQEQPAAAPAPAVIEPVEKSQVDQTQMQPLFGAQLPKSGHWQPLTQQERWKLFIKQDFTSPVTAVRPIIPTLLTFATRNPQEWPRNLNGTAKRYGANWVGTLVGDFTETAGALALHQETRYIACPCTSAKGRLWNAVRQVVQTYNDQGHWTFATARVASNYTSAAVAVYAVYPQGAHPFREFLNYGGSQFYYTAIGNLSREFLPDLLRVMRKKKNRASLVPPPPPPATK